MGKGRDVTIDKGFLIPNGILKIIETMINIICLILAAGGYWASGCAQGLADRLVGWILDPLSATYRILHYMKTCTSSHEFALATAATLFVLTVLIFLLFFFCVPDMTCGKEVWNIIDLVHDVLAIMFYLVSFILACVFANGVRAMIALAICCLLNLSAYIISLVFIVMGLKGWIIGKVTTTPYSTHSGYPDPINTPC